MYLLPPFLNIPIVTYHQLSVCKAENKYVCWKNDFYDQMQVVATKGYCSILLEDYIASLSASSGFSGENKIVLTFDDGHQSDYEIAFRILLDLGLSAIFFITTDWIGKKGYMSAENLRELDKYGMSVQAHGKQHFYLDKLSKSDLYVELNDSKKKLEDILGRGVDYMSCPGGRYNAKVLHYANQLAYKGVLCSNPFYLKSVGPCLLIGRHMVKYNMDYESNFIKCLDVTWERRCRCLGESLVKTGLRKVLGNKLYYMLWKRVVGK